VEVKLQFAFDSLVCELKKRGVSDEEIKQIEKDAERCSQGWAGLSVIPTSYIARIMGVSEESMRPPVRDDRAFVEMFSVLSSVYFASKVMENLSKLEK